MRLKTDAEYERFKALINWMIENFGDVTQTKLAELMAIDPSGISRWINPKIKQTPSKYWGEIIRLMDWDWNDLHDYITGDPSSEFASRLPKELVLLIYKQHREQRDSTNKTKSLAIV